MSKLTHFAHPAGWVKGERVEAVGGLRVELDRNQYHPIGTAPEGKEITFLQFTRTEHRDQWLKWWRKV